MSTPTEAQARMSRLMTQTAARAWAKEYATLQLAEQVEAVCTLWERVNKVAAKFCIGLHECGEEWTEGR